MNPYRRRKDVSALPRPRKCRKVCQVPSHVAFSPEGGGAERTVILTVDEYEAIRLIDKENLSQEECAARMQVARTTVQQIYADARRKIAEFLVEGLPLRIEGGDYRLCTGGDHACGPQERCPAQQSKGEQIMTIAVTYENGNIFQHFGHTEQFKVYDVQDGKIVASRVVSTNGSGHGALAGVLNSLNADVLICGGIGGGAQMALANAGIRLFGGVSGNADAAVEALISGNLAYNPNVRCSHHGEHHHHEGGCGSHGCGDHHHEGGCGSHGCGSH